MALTIAANNVQGILGYRFNEPRIMLEALGAAGSGFNLNHTPSTREGNKRLALVGDSILKLMVLDSWYSSGTETAVGGQRVSTIGANANLTDRGRQVGLHNFISTNPSQGDLPPSPRVVAATVEALIAAVWYDSEQNLQMVHQVIQNLGLVTPADEQF